MATPVYICNWVTIRALLANTASYQIWLGKSPDLSHMRVFGSHCWYVLPELRLKKLDQRAHEAVMVGY